MNRTSKEERRAETYISTLFDKEIFTQQTFGTVQIIENGIGSAKNKTNQVKKELIKLGIKLQGDLTEGRLLRKDNRLTRIELRTAISTWNSTTKTELRELIINKNIFYVIQFGKLPEFETIKNYQSFLNGLEIKLLRYQTNEKRSLLKDLKEIKYSTAAEIIYQIITGRKRLKGDLRGAIAESASEYVFENALEKGLKLTTNFTIYEDKIKKNKTKFYVGSTKEMDFILTSGDRLKMKQFRQNLEKQGLGIIINEEYEALTIGKQNKFYQKQY